jgi:hypothetical protein
MPLTPKTIFLPFNYNQLTVFTQFCPINIGSCPDFDISRHWSNWNYLKRESRPLTRKASLAAPATEQGSPGIKAFLMKPVALRDLAEVVS